MRENNENSLRAFRTPTSEFRAPDMRGAKLWLIIPAALVAIVLFGPASSLDDYARNSSIDILHYSIHLELKDSIDEITAETSILIAFNSEGVKELVLDFGNMAVDRVGEDGRDVRFTHERGKLRVGLGGNHPKGDRSTITVNYHGKPADGLIIKKNKFGDWSVFADNWPDRAHQWFPGIDHPYDKATVEFFVTAPNRFDVVGNGELVETRSLQNGSKLTRWRQDVPIPTYCMVVGAAEFATIYAGSWNKIPVSYYLYPKDRDRGIVDFGRAVQMIEFYSNLIGPYPYEKLALVQSSTRFGGMENSSAIFFDETAFRGTGRLEGTVAHEIAHQWFGDSVTENDWHHLWLSEGFATYFGHLFFERAEGRDRLVELMRIDKEVYIRTSQSAAPPIHDPSIVDLMKLLNSNNYQKGGWVLHMLRHVMGDDKFFAGIRDYYRQYRDRNAVTEDFQRVMEYQAGRNLDWFFKEWIYGPGHPIFEVSWRWAGSDNQLFMRVAQRQQGPVFRMPIDVEMNLDSQKRREIIEISEREQTFTFKLSSKPRAVYLDPDEWVLKTATVTEVTQ